MEQLKLKQLPFESANPLLLVILDGIGIYKGKDEGYPGNALDLANAPTIKNLMDDAPLRTSIQAHGSAVGLPSDDDMGNSEVGHNAMGAGRIFAQGALLIEQALKSGSLFEGETWQKLVGSRENPGLAQKPGQALHLIGLLSDGNVHSNIAHLLQLIDNAHSAGVKKLFVHTLLDGRDVEKISAERYLKTLEDKLRKLDPAAESYLIASGGGRMQITMDRYEADWSMVERGWQTHVAGRGRHFPDVMTALETLRAENPGIIDQNLPPFVIGREEEPVGPIRDGDAVILFNFRGDRAIEISRAFTEKDFTAFRREPEVSVHYAGIMQYDGDSNIPPDYLVEPPVIEKNLGRYLAANQISQYAISETQKFGHVTYFWNGNNSQRYDEKLETWREIKSDVIPFEQKPEMKAREITDALVEALQSKEYRFLRVNYSNGDMVGHTGDIKAAIRAVEAVDENLNRLLESAKECGATVIVTADHGNCEEMFETDKKGEASVDEQGEHIAKTSHTTNPVPFMVTGAGIDGFQIDSSVEKPGLANLAATILYLLGLEKPEEFLPSLVRRN